jgi:hypothetical protein
MPPLTYVLMSFTACLLLPPPQLPVVRPVCNLELLFSSVSSSVQNKHNFYFGSKYRFFWEGKKKITQKVRTKEWERLREETYRVVQIWPGQTVTCLHTNSPGHIWTTLYMPRFWLQESESKSSILCFSYSITAQETEKKLLHFVVILSYLAVFLKHVTAGKMSLSMWETRKQYKIWWANLFKDDWLDHYDGET